MGSIWDNFDSGSSGVAPAPTPAPSTATAPSGGDMWAKFDAEQPGDAMRGFKTAFQQVPQLGYGLAAISASALETALGEGGVASAAKTWAVKGYQDWGARIQAGAHDTDEFDVAYGRAKDGDFGALVDWMQYGVGYGLGQVVQALGTAGVGAIAGKLALRPAVERLAAGMVAKEAERLVATGVAKEAAERQAVASVAAKAGALAATGAQAFGMEGGEIGGDLAERSAKEGRALTGTELARAAGATAIAGMFEFAGDAVGLGALLGKAPVGKSIAEMSGLKGRAARGLVAGAMVAPVEGATEYMQTGAEEFGKGNEAGILPWNQSPEAQRQAKNAAALGALGGAVMGVGGGVVSGARPADAAPDDPGTVEGITKVVTATDIDTAISEASRALDQDLAGATVAEATPATQFSTLLREEDAGGLVGSAMRRDREDRAFAQRDAELEQQRQTDLDALQTTVRESGLPPEDGPQGLRRPFTMPETEAPKNTAMADALRGALERKTLRGMEDMASKGLIQSEMDAAANEAATSPENDLPEPSQAQIEAGNYRKGHVRIHGLDISIENPNGSDRKGIDEKGKPWSAKLAAHYGYIRGTEGADGDHVDVFVGPEHQSDRAYVVDQLNSKTGAFDESKILLGFSSRRDALKAYLGSYTDDASARIQSLSESDVPTLKQWLSAGDTKKPFDLERKNAWPKAREARAALLARISTVADDEAALPQSKEQAVSVLRRTGDQSVPAVAKQLPDLSDGREPSTVAGNGTGSQGQQQGVRAGERAVDNAAGTAAQSQERAAVRAPGQENVPGRVGDGNQRPSGDARGPDTGVRLDDRKGADNASGRAEEKQPNADAQRQDANDGGVGKADRRELQNVEDTPSKRPDAERGDHAGAVALKPQLYVERGGQRFPVASLEDAADKWRQFFTAAVREGAGGSSGEIGGAKVVDESGKEVARISQNGKVWPPGEWKSGMKPLIGESFKPSDTAESEPTPLPAPTSNAQTDQEEALPSYGDMKKARKAGDKLDRAGGGKHKVIQHPTVKKHFAVVPVGEPSEKQRKAREAAGKRLKAIAAASRRISAGDNLLAVIAKLGGLNLDAIVKEWGVDPADVRGLRGAGILLVAKKNGGMTPDAMGEALSELGRLKTDEHGKWDLADLEADFDRALRKAGGAQTAEDVYGPDDLTEVDAISEEHQIDVAEVVATSTPEQWSTMSEEDKNAELDAIFGPENTAAEGEGPGTQAPAQEVGQGSAAGEQAEAEVAPSPAIGDLVKLQIPGPKGPMNIAGTIVRLLSGDRVEVRTQQHGYVTKAASEVSVHGSKDGELKQSSEAGAESIAPYQFAESTREASDRWAFTKPITEAMRPLYDVVQQTLSEGFTYNTDFNKRVGELLGQSVDESSNASYEVYVARKRAEGDATNAKIAEAVKALPIGTALKNLSIFTQQGRRTLPIATVSSVTERGAVTLDVSGRGYKTGTKLNVPILNQDLQDALAAQARPTLALDSQTEDELKASQDALDAAAKKKADADSATEAKRKADAERGDFALSGSDRQADANPNQSDVFAEPPNPMVAAADALIQAANAMKAAVQPTEQASEPRLPRKGDRFTDANGDLHEVWSERGGRVEAFRVVNGKMIVHSGAAEHWAITDAAKGRFPDDRIDLNLLPKEKKPVTPQVPAKPAAPTAAPIADFGSKIGGAKKDLWQAFKEKIKDAQGADIAAEPLSKSWPIPDYEALLSNGADPWAVAFMHAARDEVPAKPRRSFKVKRWAEQVTMLRDTAFKLAQGELSVEKAQTELAKMAGASSGMMSLSTRVELYQLVGHAKSLEGVRISRGEYSLYEGKDYRPPKVIWSVEKEAAATAFSNWPRMLATGDTKAEALQAFKDKYDTLEISTPAKKETSFEIYSQTGTEGYFVGKKAGRNIIELAGPFKTVKEARAHRDENKAALAEQLEKSKEIPSERRDTNEPRVGADMRNGQDVTPEMFGDTFGFKGVEFGNYVEQSKRQADLNDAFDALMDMAAILGIPPKAISLNGELGLAFGARGSGGVNPASAHYEPGKVVINLTKKSGAGSLGHEWWHALDNYFSRMRAKKDDFMSSALDVSLAERDSDYVHQGAVRKKMVDAFGAVMKAIRNTALKARSSKLDAKRSKDYWTTKHEMSARAFESYLISKLQDQNASNDYLANIVDEATWKAAESLGWELDGSYPYPTAGEVPAIRAAFDHFFQTVETKETDRGTAIFSSAENAVPESEWLSEAAIAQIVEERIGQFAHQPPVLIVDRGGDIAPGLAAETISGATFRGRMYLVREGLRDDVAANRTLWHELLHYGLRRFLTREQYISQMTRLYSRDGWIKREAKAWMAGPEAASLREKGESAGYIRARGVDEALAGLAETNEGDYQQTGPVARAIRAVARWVAEMAERFGFQEAAARWRSVTNDEARAMIRVVFGKLRADAPATSSDWAFTADPAFHKAWHGSPHDFDEFKLQHIGSGEGAQAYGWGMYFASNKGVAQHYREQLQKTTRAHNTYKGRKVSNLAIEQAVAAESDPDVAAELRSAAIYASNGERLFDYLTDAIKYEKAQAEASSKRAEELERGLRDGSVMSSTYQPEQHRQFAERHSRRAAALEKIAGNYERVEERKSGKLYEVELAPKEDEYLGWDKPLSDQSAEVIATLKQYRPEYFERGWVDTATGNPAPNAKDHGLSDEQLEQRGFARRIPADSVTGQQFYATLADEFGGANGRNSHTQQQASKSLHSIGIPGIRYLDGSSRGGRAPYKGDPAYRAAAEDFKGNGRTASQAIEGMKSAYKQADPAELQAAVDEVYDIQPKPNHNFVIFDDSLVKIDAKFSRASQIDGNAIEERAGITENTLRAAVADAFGQAAADRLIGKIVVPLDDQSKLPKHIVPFVRKGDTIYGFHDPKTDKTYAVLSNLTRDMVRGLVMHEVGVHYGFEKMLGKAKYEQVMKRLDVMARAGNKAVNEARARAVEESAAESQVAEETLAYLVTDHPQLGVIKEVIAAIRAFLFKQFGLLADSLTQADLVALARGSVQGAGIENGEPAFAPAFERDGDSADARFARSSVAGSQTTGDFRDNVTAGAIDFVRDLMHTDGKIGLWAKTIGTQQDKAATIPEFKPVYDEGQAFISDVSKYANEAADAAQDLLPRIEGFRDFAKKSPSTAEIEQVTQALYAGTLFGGGSPLKGRKWTDDELRAGRGEDTDFRVKDFEPLNDRQVALYRQTLDSVGLSLDGLAKSLLHKLSRLHGIGFDRDMSLEDVAQVLRDRVDEAILDQTAALEGENEAAAKDAEQAISELKKLKDAITDIEQKVTTLKDKGYFPAMRFGQYAVHVVETNKAGEPVQRYFGLFESQTKANLAARELAKEYPSAQIGRSIISQEQHRLFQGMSLDTIEAFADYITGEDGQPIAKDPLVQGFLKAAVSERSTLKRHIHRKGVAGFSKDLPRVLASFTVSSARATSSNYHAAEMLRLANDVKAGDVKDEAIKLVRYLQDPIEEAQAIRGFMFAQFLGGSIAHGLVNMTQPFMVTGPYLTQYTTIADAAAKLGEAMTTKPESLTGRIAEAYKRAKAEGVVAPQEIHQLRAETGGMPLGRSLAMRKLSFLWGSIYAITEQFNRTTTFLAAYKIAAEKGMADPYAFAANTVNETQFVYNKGNRPNLARGPIGATVFTFKQFSISYLELAKRMYRHDKRSFALMMLMLVAAAGLEGAPFAEDIEDLIDTVGQWMGYATNSKKKLRQWATALLGPDLAQVALKGVSGLPWMPVDVSVRMGLQNLIPGTAMLKPSEKNKARDVLELVGPIGQFVPTDDTMLGRALERLSNGDVFGAVKAGAPVAIQNMAKGADMLDKGYATDTKGKKITAVSPAEAVLKMAGLQPSSVARESVKVQVAKQDIDMQRRMESEIAEQWARGQVDGRPEEIRAAMRKLSEWNRDNPELRIRVTTDQIRRRVKEMRTTREDRFVKSAPPEIRSGVRDALR